VNEQRFRPAIARVGVEVTDTRLDGAVESPKLDAVGILGGVIEQAVEQDRFAVGPGRRIQSRDGRAVEAREGGGRGERPVPKLAVPGDGLPGAAAPEAGRREVERDDVGAVVAMHLGGPGRGPSVEIEPAVERRQVAGRRAVHARHDVGHARGVRTVKPPQLGVVQLRVAAEEELVVDDREAARIRAAAARIDVGHADDRFGGLERSDGRPCGQSREEVNDRRSLSRVCGHPPGFGSLNAQFRGHDASRKCSGRQAGSGSHTPPCSQPPSPEWGQGQRWDHIAAARQAERGQRTKSGPSASRDWKM